MNLKKKLSIYLLVCSIVLCTAVGGTIAWLTDKTESVVNTFTFGDINITLEETTGQDYKMVPGNEITKDPTVTVKKDSEACWLFVKVVQSDNFSDFMTYEIAEGWSPLTGVSGVYYREVEATTADTTFKILKNDQVLVKETVTKEMFNDVDFVQPTLTFTAYAVQKDNIATVTDAWAKVTQ